MFFWKTPDYKIITNLEDLSVLLEKIESAISDNKPICIDVETTGATEESGLNYYYNWLLGVSISLDTDIGYYIPLNHTDQGVRRENQLTTEQLASKLNPIVSTKGVYIGHNIKFDYIFLWRAGIKLNPRLWCTSIALQLINGDAYKTRALKKVIKDYVDVPSTLIQTFTEVAQGNAAEQDPEEMSVYAINDVIFTFYLYMSLKPIIDTKYSKLFYEAEAPLVSLLGQIEMKGIRIDVKYFKQIRVRLLKYVKQIEKHIQNKYGINIGSTQQVGKLYNKMFGDFQLKKNNQTGNIITDVKALKDILNTQNKKSDLYKLTKRVLTFRGLNKSLNTYIDKFPAICDEIYTDKGIDYIVHTSFDQIKNSGRMSSRPNIQNIPRDSNINIRRGFIARRNYKILEADWSSAELRIAAVASQEPKILKEYEQNPIDADLHALTAKNVFNKKKITKDERHIGKTLNFSLLYGATSYGVGKLLDIDRKLAQKYVDSYYNAYSKIAEWRDKLGKQIEEKRYTSTFYGRRRYLRGDLNKNMYDVWKYEAGKRQLINHIIQGTCADMLKFSLINLAHKFAKEDINAYIITHTHDSIVVETNEIERTEKALKEIMEVKIKNVFMPIDIDIKNSFSKINYT